LHNDLIPTIKNCGFSKKDIQGKSGDLYKYLNTLVDAYRPLIAPFKKEHMEKPKVLNKLSAPQVSLFGGTAAIKHSIAQAWNKLSDDAKEALPKEVQTLLGDNGLGFMTSDELSSESLTGLQKSVKYVLKKDKVLKAWNSLNKDGQNTNHLKQTKKLTQQPVKFLQKPGINTQLLKNMLALIRATLQNENYQGDEYKGSLKTGGLVNH